MGLLEDSRIEVSLIEEAPSLILRRTAPWSRLEFAMQHQDETFWCWAATSVSVAHYYENASNWTQCRMVNEERRLTTCCRDGAAPGCNVPNVLQSPLERVDVLDRWQRGSVSFDRIREEIDAGRPLAWRIQWPDGTGHFAVIEGYQSSNRRLLAVEDPWTGSVDVPFASLQSGRYRGNGKWTHSYFTKRPRAR
jgi:hypothetical protein